MKWLAGFFIFIIFLLASRGSFCQDSRHIVDQVANRFDVLVAKDTRSSAYLQTNKNIYVCGEDLWFNAFMLDAQAFTLSTLDKTLYIQLQRKEGDSIVWQEIYPINNGLSNGHIYLPQTLPEGDYLLKGYSAHSFFPGQLYFYAVAPIKVVKEPRTIGEHKLKAPGSHIKRAAVVFKVFAEGGNLIAGLQNRVAFKAVYKNGQPVEVNGTLLKNNEPLLIFKTAHAGMGSILFTPEKNAEYRIRLENNNDSLYTIPKIQDNGIVMRLLKNEKDSLVFRITTNHTPDKKKVFLRLQVRGMVQAVAAGVLTDSLEIKIPTQDAPQGIAEATLFDEQLRPLAERLVYLHPDQALTIRTSQLKQQYKNKDKVGLRIKVTDTNGKPVPAALSLRVYDQLFDNPGNTRDIVNYYYLSTQLQGNIYDPSYYFDTASKDRLQAMDLLLLTQGWRRYTWNEEVLKEYKLYPGQSLLSDSLQAHITTTKKGGKIEAPVSCMLFNYNQSITQIAVTDSAGKLSLSPGNLAIGSRFFIKYFSEKEYIIQIPDPMNGINTTEAVHIPEYVFAESNSERETVVTDTGNMLQYEKTMDEVRVFSKGRGYGDKYLGFLDSVARYEGNTDYIGACGWLNCPACNHGTKPVEGVVYSELTGSKKSRVASHPFQFTPADMKTSAYHYQKYTEEELLKKFKMGVTKGYYESRTFYEPDYDNDESSVPDNRNTLAWDPTIITDENGEATVHFFCSDIYGRFTGVIEGVSGEGILGATRFSFNVK